MAYQFERIDAHHCMLDGTKFTPVICPKMSRYYGKTKYGLSPEGMSCNHRYHPGSMGEVEALIDQWEREKDDAEFKLRDDPLFNALVDFDSL